MPRATDPVTCHPAAAALDPQRCRPDAWMLDPSIDFLNHGSFGARAREIVAQQADHRRAFEAQPIDWLDRRRDAQLDVAVAAVGRFLGVSPDRFGFVTNASAAVCAVLRSFPFAAGDEILTTDHAYGAVMRTIEYVARDRGAVPVVASVPVPVPGPEAVVDAIEAAMTERTRLLVIDHVSSPTAMVLPVRELVALARQRGVRVLIDGAHGPGMLELDVTALGADWYAGNLHKWVCAPVGAAFLYASDDAPRVHPPIISHFHEEDFAVEFRWQGTRDITPWLTVPAAIRWMAELGGAGADASDEDRDAGWANVRRHNDALAAEAATTLAESWGTAVTAPPSMRAAMATVALPPAWQGVEDRPEGVRDRLHRHHGIEVPVVDVAGLWHVRISAQVYNRPAQYARLADIVARGPG